MGGHSLPPLVHPTFFQPSPLDPSALTSQPQLNSLPYHNHQMHPPGFLEPRPQVQSVGNVNNTNGCSSNGNNFQNKWAKLQGTMKRVQRSVIQGKRHTNDRSYH